MPATTTLPIMAGLSILGVALGVNLGRSAISEINPAYFSEAEDSFHSDLVPYRSPDWAQVQASEYRAAQQPVLVGDLGSGCIGCRDYPVEYVPRHEPAVDGYPDDHSANVPAAPAQIVIVETPASDPARERIQLYATYPVTAGEEPAAATDPATEDSVEPTGL
ncbi:MAG TPA: hypothetical protein VEA60_03925 [Allosphingosinicella sp.]|nr:hypothetical protein [Allosphingosinicella sp.]